MSRSRDGMRRHASRHVVGFVLVLALMIVETGCSEATSTTGRDVPETVTAFAATMEATTPDGITSTGELLAADGAYRMEIVNGRHASMFIARFDRGVVWLFVPEDKTFTVLELTTLNEDIPQFFSPDVVIDRDAGTPESVEETDTVRYEVTTSGSGGVHRGTLWESVALAGRPVRWEDADSGLVVVFKNARELTVPGGAFEVPDGYSEVDSTAAR